MIPYKTLSVLTLFLLPSQPVLPLQPDEGQWLPMQIREMDWEKLKARGMEMSKDEFWHPEKGGVLSAAVLISGCSAAFVSEQGLVVTNHHCGFGAVQRLSSVTRNYVRDGFVAEQMQDELRTSMTVSIVRMIEDVTKQVHAEQQKATSPVDRLRRTQAIMQQLVSEGKKQPNTDCMVAPFYEGREYYLYYRTLIRDVRLVYAPPRSVGEYGGEVDNWEWPRHTGDFCFFRAYAAPDGTPRGYHEDNVPFKPEHYLKVSTKGVHENDLVLILGYPGQTERYLSSVAVADRQTFYYPMRYELLTKIIGIMEAASAGDEAKTLRYTGSIKSLANVQKNALGMVKGLDRNATVQLKLEEEEMFEDWVQANEERKAKHGSLLAELKELDSDASKTAPKDLFLSLLLSTRTTPFFRMLMDMVDAAGKQSADEEPKFNSDFARMVRSKSLERDLEEIQVKIFAYLVEQAQEMPEEQRLTDIDAVPGKELAKALEQSSLRTAKGRKAFLDAAPASVTESKDPLVKLLAGLAKELGEYRKRQTQEAGRRLVLGPKWIEAQQEWRGKSFYPDANRTLRVAIASVKGYQPRDGVYYGPHTTVAGVIEKNQGKDPFHVPDVLLKAARHRQESKYNDKQIGDVPVCFLADGDTTGGNSGSPVINGKGELVGLNFDRAFESVSGDYGWNAERSRNISVDIRYVLWFLEQVIPAPRLLKEMKQ